MQHISGFLWLAWGRQCRSEEEQVSKPYRPNTLEVLFDSLAMIAKFLSLTMQLIVMKCSNNINTGCEATSVSFSPHLAPHLAVLHVSMDMFVPLRPLFQETAIDATQEQIHSHCFLLLSLAWFIIFLECIGHDRSNIDLKRSDAC